MANVVLSNPWVRFAGGVGLLALLCLTAWLLVPVLTPVLLALIFAYCFHPVVVFLERHRVPRAVTVLALVLTIALLVVSVPLVVVPGVVHEADRLVQAARQGIGNGWMDRLVDRLPLHELVVDLGWAPEGVTEFNERAVIAEHLGQLVKDNALHIIRGYGDRIAGFGRQAGISAANLVGTLAGIALNVVGWLVSLCLFLFVVVEVLNNYDKMVASMAGLIPMHRRARVADILGKIDVQLKSFLRGQLTVCGILMCLYGIGLSLCGVPFAVPVAIMGGLANVVPFAPLALGLIPALLLTLLSYGIDGHLAGVLAVYGVVQFLEGNFLTPRIVGSKVGLNPAWVIVSILVFSNVLGFIGLLMAVPSAAVAKVLIQEAVAVYKDSPVFRGPSSDESSS